MDTKKYYADKCKTATGEDFAVSIQLRDIELDDLPILYEFQLDQEANRLAATIPRNLSEFNAHWQNSLQDSSVIAKVISCQHSPADARYQECEEAILELTGTRRI